MLNDLRIYLDVRIFRILIIGFISGFPWVLTGAIMSLWLKDFGMSLTTVGIAGSITFVYAINFLWAPLVDRIRVPILSNLLGHRRAWIVSLQATILICLLVWSILDPTQNLTAIVLIGLIIAIASATQDITIDALRIEQIDKDDAKLMSAGAAAAVVGWWTGYKLGGVIALTTADALQTSGVANYWQQTILYMGVVVVLCNILLLFVREISFKERMKQFAETQAAYRERFALQSQTFSWYHDLLAWLATTVVEPLWSFFKRNGLTIGLALLGFVFLFKIGEAFLGRMSILFYQEIGFSKTDIALYSKGLGWVVTVSFTILGSYFAVKAGIVRALVVAGLAMAITNLLFSLLAWTGKSELLFAVAVLVDDLTSAIASVIFVAFISMLVDRRYTATQYALLASIGTAGRTVFASGSGLAVDALGGDWGTFFVITAIMVTPSLACLWILRHRLRDLLGGVVTEIRGRA